MITHLSIGSVTLKITWGIFQIPPLLVDAPTNIAFIFPSSARKCCILGTDNLSGVTYKAIDAIFFLDYYERMRDDNLASTFKIRGGCFNRVNFQDQIL